MDIIIWAIILGAIFYINKKSKNAGSKNTQPNKPRPQQKQMQQIWNSMQNYSSVGYECIEPDISAETTATDAAESTAGSESTAVSETTATAETAAEQSGYSAEGREK